MKILYIIPLLLALVIIPAYAETNPISITGYEITLEEYSQIWFEFDGSELKTAQLSLPVNESGEWTSIVYDLTNLTYSVNDTNEKYDPIWGEKYGKTFIITAKLSQNIFVLFNGEYVDEDTILINGEISFHDEGTKKAFDNGTVIKLQFLAISTNAEF